MTQLRDARLRRALEDAPDRGVVPQAGTREAVRAMALKAVARDRKVEAWWRRWLPAAGANRMPWNAALATLAIATLVTVLWHDDPVPDAGTQATQADRAAPAPVTGASTGSARTESARDSAARQQAGLADIARPQGAPATAAPAALPPAAPPPALPSAPVMAAAPARAPAAEAAAARSFSRDATPALAEQALAQASATPTEVRIEREGRSAVQASSNTPVLMALLATLERSPVADQPLEPPVVTRIELRTPGGAMEVIEIAGSRVRWLRASGPALVFQPEASVLQALQAEADRLLAR